MSKIRSKSLFKIGQNIDPNKLSINFNKKNQIGFQLKLLENLRNSKKEFEKFEENYSPKLDDDLKSEKKVIKRLSNNNIKYDDNSVYCISDSSISKSNNEIVIKKNITNIQNQKKLNSLTFKLISNIDSLIEISPDLSIFINKNFPINEETKLLDVWIDIENNKDNKQYKFLFLKIFFIINKYFQEEKQISKIDAANKIYYKIIKLILLVSVLCLFTIIYIGVDLGIINNIKKLVSLTTKSLLNFYEIFNLKKLSNADDVLIDKFNRMNLKGFKIQNFQLKTKDLIQYLNKESDFIGMGIKQLAK